MINVINAIEEKLQAQKDEIFFKDLQISELKKQVAAAETELAEARKTIANQKDNIKGLIKEMQAESEKGLKV